MDANRDFRTTRGICECCGYPNLPTEIYESPMNAPFTTMNAPFEFCRLCAMTMAGNSHRRGSQYPEANTLKTICFVGNAILDQLGAFKEWQDSHEHIADEDL